MQGGIASLGIIARHRADADRSDPLDHAVLLDRALHSSPSSAPRAR
jgi:hypothetical protein